MKKTLLIIALVVAGLSISAQTAPKKVLSAKEVSSFIANKQALEADLEALGDKYDSYFEGIEGSSPDAANSDPSAAFTGLRAAKVPAEIQAIMKKHGLGDNGFEKYLVISYGFGAIYLERQLDAQLKGQEITPEMKPYVDQMKLVATQMKAGVHATDLGLISDRYDDLVGIMDFE